MDYLLTEQQKMIRDLARQIAQEKIKPVAAKYDESQEFPWEIVKIMAQSDLFSIYIPEAYGGMGGGCLDLCLATEELSRACGGIALSLAATALGTYPIILFGTEEQKKKYLPKLAQGIAAGKSAVRKQHRLIRPQRYGFAQGLGSLGRPHG